MSTKRRLSKEDLELWRRVTEKTDALHRRESLDATHIPASLVATPARPTVSSNFTFESAARPSATTRHTAIDLAPKLPERLQRAPLQMDKKTFSRMTRGKLKPEGRIDLHGMTLARAQSALIHFIMSAYGSQKRLVLVITGKGKHRDEGGPIPARHGALRHHVPHWMAQPPLSHVVMQVAPAHGSHGGDGAYYVYLRRAQK
ncbi:MAG: Smr/MutS family protein [Pseudomonadota bacterium]